MTDREFRDNALIAVGASLAAVHEPVERAGKKEPRLLQPADVASRAANIVTALIERRKQMEAKK